MSDHDMESNIKIRLLKAGNIIPGLASAEQYVRFPACHPKACAGQAGRVKPGNVTPIIFIIIQNELKNFILTINTLQEVI